MALSPNTPELEEIHLPHENGAPATELKKSFFGELDAIVVACLIIGSVMATAGYLELRPNPTINRFVLVMGLGFLFGALGSTAKIGNKTWSIGGGAAIGVILGWVLSSFGSPGHFATIHLKQLPESSRATLYDADEFYRARTTRAVEFVAMPKHVLSDVFGAEILIPGREQPFEFNCLQSNIVKEAFGVEKPLSWNFVYDPQADTAVLTADNGSIISEVGPCPPQKTDDEASLLTRPDSTWNVFITPAYAAKLLSTESLIDALKSKSSFVRRQARNGLAKKGKDALPALVKTLELSNDDYRTNIGILVAMSGIKGLQATGDKPAAQSSAISTRSLQKIAYLAGHKDQTMRSYAMRVLTGLNDPRAGLAVSIALKTASPQAEEPMLEYLKQQLTKSPIVSQKELTDSLVQSLGDVNDKSAASSGTRRILIEQVTAAAKGDLDKIQKFYVQVGAYGSDDKASNFAKDLVAKNPSLKIGIANKRPGDPLVRVVAGTYQSKPDAKALLDKLKSSGVLKNGFLSSYPDQVRQVSSN